MRIALGLGSSLGPRRSHLELAIRRLAARPELELLRVSRWYRTPPLAGGAAHGWFLNGVALFESRGTAEDFLAACIALEARAGRRRARFWGDRTLDLDVLLAGDRVNDAPRLVLPHPAISRRPFVRIPLLEVWPDAIDPRSGLRYADLPAPERPRPARAGVFRRSGIAGGR